MLADDRYVSGGAYPDRVGGVVGGSHLDEGVVEQGPGQVLIAVAECGEGLVGGVGGGVHVGADAHGGDDHDGTGGEGHGHAQPCEHRQDPGEAVGAVVPADHEHRGHDDHADQGRHAEDLVVRQAEGDPHGAQGHGRPDLGPVGQPGDTEAGDHQADQPDDDEQWLGRRDRCESCGEHPGHRGGEAGAADHQRTGREAPESVDTAQAGGRGVVDQGRQSAEHREQ